MIIEKRRETKETEIYIKMDTDLPGNECKIDTGVGFMDHMLELFSFHSGIYFEIKADGDTYVDGHHTVEDIGILLGEIIREYYVSIKSYQRYGMYYIPMDETLARVVLDLSGRPCLSFNAEFSRDQIGYFDTELVQEFFTAFSMNARISLHIDLLKNGNTHHEIEGIFKAFARALKEALKPVEGGVPSSKGLIQ